MESGKDLNNATGIVWLTKNADGSSVSDDFSKMVNPGLLLDNMVRQALGYGYEDESIAVYFNGVNVGDLLDLWKNQSTIDSLVDQMKSSIQSKNLIPFKVGGKDVLIAFRSLDSITFGAGEVDAEGNAANKIYINHVNKPASADELKGLVEEALNNTTVIIESTGTVSKTGFDNLDNVELNRARFEAAGFGIDAGTNYSKALDKWPTIYNSAANDEKKAGTITVTVKAAEYNKYKNDEYKRSFTIDVYFKDQGRTNVTIDAKDQNGNAIAGFASYSYLTYEGAAIKTQAPEIEGYKFVEWSPALPNVVPATDNGQISFTAVMQKKEECTVTYLDGDGNVIKVYEDVYTGDSTPLYPYLENNAGQKCSWKVYKLTDGNVEIGGAWQPYVSGNITYIATWTEGPKAIGTLVFDGEVYEEVELELLCYQQVSGGNAYYVVEPGWKENQQEGYYWTGWYHKQPEYNSADVDPVDLNYDSIVEEYPFAMSNQVSSGNAVVLEEDNPLELYCEFYPYGEKKIRNEQGEVIGTETVVTSTVNNPLYVYEFDTGSGEKGEPITSVGEPLQDDERPTYNTSSLYQKFEYWTKVDEVISGNAIYYTYAAELRNVENGYAFVDEDGNDFFAEEFKDVSPENKETNLDANGRLTYTWKRIEEGEEVTYTAYIESSSFGEYKDGYNYLFDEADEIKVSPIWKRVGENGPETIYCYVKSASMQPKVDGQAVAYSMRSGLNVATNYEDYIARLTRGEDAHTGDVELTVVYDYLYFDVEQEDIENSNVVLHAGNDYDAKDIYDLIMVPDGEFVPEYNPEYVSVKYQSRPDNGEEISLSLDRLTELLDEMGLGALLGDLPAVDGLKLGSAMTELSKPGQDPLQAMTAQEVVDQYLEETFEELKTEKFGNLPTFKTEFLGDLATRIEEQTIEQFAYLAPGEEKSTELVQITYECDEYKVEKTYTVPVVEKTENGTHVRKVTEFNLPNDVKVKYNDDVAGKILANVTLTGVDAVDPEDITLVTLHNGTVRNFSNAGAGTYTNVQVLFRGNETYKPAISAPFTVTVEKLAPVVTVKNLIEDMRGDNYTAEAHAQVSPNAPIVQITAGIKAAELKLGEDMKLTPGNNMVIDVWIKLPAEHIELLNGLELDNLNGFKEGVELPSKTIHTGWEYYEEDLVAALRNFVSKDLPGKEQVQTILNILDSVPEEVLAQLGLDGTTYSLKYRLDALGEKAFPIDPGFYVNFGATLSYFTAKMGVVDKNYGVNKNLGFIVLSPMIPVPNRGGIQLYDGGVTTNAENVFIYEYNGEPIERKLEIALDGVKLEKITTKDGKEADARAFYYGISTRLDVITQENGKIPTMPGVYLAGFNYYDWVENTVTNQMEPRRLGSDSALIIIKQREVDMEIKGKIVEYDATKKQYADIVVTDKDGKEVTDAGVTVISGTVNAKADGSNITANDFYGTVNIDFPTALDEKWASYWLNEQGRDTVPSEVRPSDLAKFLEWCGNKAESDMKATIGFFRNQALRPTVSKILNKINNYQDIADVSSENLVDKLGRVQDLTTAGNAYYQDLLDRIKPLQELEKVDDNLWISFKDLKDLDYSATGYYLYMGVVTDPDLTVAAGKGLVIIHSEDDYVMYDEHVPYDGYPHSIFTEDETSRGDVKVMIDRAANEIKFFLDGDVYKAMNAALDKAGYVGVEAEVNDGSNVYVSTVYEKAENYADVVYTELAERLKAKAEAEIKRLNGIVDGEAVNGDVQILIDKANAKMSQLTERLSNKLQEVDKLPEDTRIYLYEMSNGSDLYGMPVDAGTYEFYGYDYDVSATRGTLVIEPIYIVVEDDDKNKYEGEQDPELTAKVSYYSYKGLVPSVAKVEGPESPEDTEYLALPKLPEGLTDIADLVSYKLERTPGEAAGKYDISVKEIVLHETSGNYKLDVDRGEDAEHKEDKQDFEIYPEIGTIELGEWRMQLDSVVYLQYYPTLKNFSDKFDFENRAGVIIWSNTERYPQSRGEVVKDNKDNVIDLRGWIWNEETQEWFMRTHEIFAKNLGDRVYIRPYVVDKDGNYKYLDGAPYYSPKLFAYDVLNAYDEEKGEYTEEEGKRKLCAALLFYGASAQNYFDYRNDTDADEHEYNLMTVIPDKFKAHVDWSKYPSVTEYSSSYRKMLEPSEKAKELAKTLDNNKEHNKQGVVYNDSTLQLAGAIRFSVGFDFTNEIDPENILSKEVLFWNERDFENIDTLAYDEYDRSKCSFVCELNEATKEEIKLADIGSYRALSGHIVAKYIDETVYFTCRVVMKDGTVYNSGLVYYSPEAFAGDHIDSTSTDTIEGQEVVTVSERIIVYGEMAKEWFGIK